MQRFEGGDYEGTGIFVMNADGSEPVNVSNSESFDSKPACRPTGHKIAFTSYRDFGDGLGDPGMMYVMNADGSDRSG